MTRSTSSKLLFFLSFYWLNVVESDLTSGSAIGGILYPRESETRQVTSLDGIWNFRLSGDDQLQGFKEKWYAKDLAKSGPVIFMPVPSSYNDITVDKRIRDYVGLVWYDRTFFVPDSWRQSGYHVWLRFGSVHYAAQVWINGHLVMSHEIGHLPFLREVTSYVLFGKQNRVTVAVDNTLLQTTIPQGTIQELAVCPYDYKGWECNDPRYQAYIPESNGQNPKSKSKWSQYIRSGECYPRKKKHSNDKVKPVQSYTFDFFNYAGIHRSVHLYTTPTVYIDDITVTTDIKSDGTTGLIHYNVTVGGPHNEDSPLTCSIGLLDKEGDYVVRTNRNSDQNCLIGKIEVPNATLWWPYLMHKSPAYMYTLEVQISHKEWGADIYRLPVGIRKLQWNSTGMTINEKPIYMRGFGRHEDSDFRGKGLDLAVTLRDYDLIKWIGANAYRTSHYPYAEEIMDLADQSGIMIIDECPAVDLENYSPILRKKHKDSLAELIRRDKNRPSVIMWSIANEPRSQQKEADNHFRSVSTEVRQRDPTRPITAAIAVSYASDLAGTYLDIIGFNRYNSWYSNTGKLETIQGRVEDEAMKWHLKYNKPVFMCEYGADTLNGLHFAPSYVWSEEFQVECLSEHFKAFDNLRKKNFFIGEFIWNFADFKTAQSITRVGGNRKGIFTRDRQPKAAAFDVRRRYWSLAKIDNNASFPCDLFNYYHADESSQCVKSEC